MKMYILKKLRPLTIALPFSLLFISANSFATTTNYSGTYEGIDSGTNTSCFNPRDNGPFNDSVTFTVTQTGNTFTGSGNDNGDTFSASGTIDVSGSFTGTFNDSNGSSGTLNGSFSSTQLSYSSSTTSPGPDGCLTSSSGTLTKTSGSVVASEAQVQQSRQIVRATNSLISQHLATEVSSAFSIIPNNPADNALGASSDKESWSPDAFWGTTSLTEIHEDNDNVTNFDTDVYQFVGGFDQKIGNFFVGSALTYAYGETEQTGQDTTSHVIGVTPYGAYQINNFMFISALAGYNYSYIKDENFGTDADVHDYTLESNLNFYKTFLDSIIVKSRVGTRFHHSYVSSTDKPLDATTDELVWLGDFELGYRFNNKLTTYVGSYYEYFDREASTHHLKEHDGILYMRGGFEYPLTNKLNIGGKVQADLTDEDTDLITGSINIRLAM